MKNWIEIGEHNKPEIITADLLVDEEAINIVKKSEEDDWEYVFQNQEKHQNIVGDFSEQMHDVMPPQSADLELRAIDPTTIQLETEIMGEKIWLDNHATDRPDSITVYLFANNERIDEQIISAQNDWKYRFTNVPEYDALGEKINYSIVEEPIEGYQTSYKGYDIVNLRKGVTELKIIKTWQSHEKDQYQGALTVDLLQNERKFQRVYLSEATNWQQSFTNLPKYDDQGKAYDYTIKDLSSEKLNTRPTKIHTKKDTFLENKEVSNLAVPIVGGILFLLGLVAGRNRKK